MRVSTKKNKFFFQNYVICWPSAPISNYLRLIIILLMNNAITFYKFENTKVIFSFPDNVKKKKKLSKQHLHHIFVSSVFTVVSFTDVRRFRFHRL